jgi:metal-sulfur cluster biosynthetic enzyme
MPNAECKLGIRHFELGIVNHEYLWRALAAVNDPEIPISVVDMGLIQEITCEETSGRVRVQLTFTAMGCPAMEMIVDDIRARLLREPGVRDVQIEIVWDPPWTKARLSKAGRARLRQMGVGV